MAWAWRKTGIAKLLPKRPPPAWGTECPEEAGLASRLILGWPRGDTNSGSLGHRLGPLGRLPVCSKTSLTPERSPSLHGGVKRVLNCLAMTTLPTGDQTSRVSQDLGSKRQIRVYPCCLRRKASSR